MTDRNEFEFVFCRIHWIDRHRAVHVRGKEIDTPAGEDRFLHNPVTRETIEYIIHLPALYHFLTGFNVRDNTHPFGADRLRLFLPLGFARELHHRESKKRFMAVWQYVDIIRIQNTQIDTHLVRTRYPIDDILTILINDLALVSHCNTQAHRLQSQAHVVTVNIGQTRTGRKHHLAVYAAREDIQFLPEFLSLCRS